MTNSTSVPQGYLLEDFRLFHLNDLNSGLTTSTTMISSRS